MCSEIDLVGSISGETVVTRVCSGVGEEEIDRRESWGLTWRWEFTPCLLIFEA